MNTGSHCVAVAVLELTIYTRLPPDSQTSTSLNLQSAGIKGVCHRAWRDYLFTYYYNYYSRGTHMKWRKGGSQ